MLLSDVGGAGADTASGHKCQTWTETETEASARDQSRQGSPRDNIAANADIR